MSDMRCPKCGHRASRVVDVRSSPEMTALRRRRECLDARCRHRFTTREIGDDEFARLTAPSGYALGCAIEARDALTRFIAGHEQPDAKGQDGTGPDGKTAEPYGFRSVPV